MYICGGIASGKTSFANLAKTIKLHVVYEDFKKNPFWKAFYTNPGKYIFETEISFILLHYHQIKKAYESYSKLICDFSFLVDLAYAKIGLRGSKLKAFKTILKEIENELSSPDLIIYLKCDTQTQLERIRRRARAEERYITIEFLEGLNAAIENEIERARSSQQILTIDSREKDFVNDQKVKKEMVEMISEYIK